MLPITTEALIFEKSRPGLCAVNLGESDVPKTAVPGNLAREELAFPEVDELSLVRHFTRLSHNNFSIDSTMYPLGSCTMKYNPKVNEAAASRSGWRNSHPLAGDALNQGALALMYTLSHMLCSIGGFSAGSLHPAAGSQGELAGILMIRKYHLAHGGGHKNVMLVPDSAHGTNPASCTMAGYITKTIPSNASGEVDLADLDIALAAGNVAGIMVTNPNTLGLFERQIDAICAKVHAAGGLVYGDGANMNALAGVFAPATAGIDVMHFNLHKTFSTPHGGGGPGGGFVGCTQALAPYLPGPNVVEKSGRYTLEMPAHSIGKLKAFAGNFAVMVRAFAYLRALGAEGVRLATEDAVLNANYLRKLLAEKFPAMYSRRCMHEFVTRGDIAPHINAFDVAKSLLDKGFHPPTIYFPLIVPDAIMIEPTETESRETIEAYAKAMIEIAETAHASPDELKRAPVTTVIGRLDDVEAARNPVLRYTSAD